MTDFTAPITRLYDTIFDRAPDPVGLDFWERSMDHGYSLTVLADHFMRAPEFAATYGQPTNHAFVESLYANILDRAGEAEGIAFWTAALDEGRAQRNETVFAFSESQEHIVQMAAPATAPAPVAAAPAPVPAPALPADTTALPETSPGPYQSTADGGPIPKQLYTGSGPNAELLVGGDGFDQLFALGTKDAVLWGQGGNDFLRSYDGNDVLHGGAGDDVLLGFVGDDVLFGGPGSDTLNGGAGTNVLTGGDGEDTFVFNATASADTITDFQRGEHLRVQADRSVAPGMIATGTGGALVFDLDQAHPHFATVEFQGLTAADEGWVRDAFLFG